MLPNQGNYWVLSSVMQCQIFKTHRSWNINISAMYLNETFYSQSSTLAQQSSNVTRFGKLLHFMISLHPKNFSGRILETFRQRIWNW